MNDDFFFESEGDDFFGATNANPQPQPNYGQPGSGAPQPPPPPPGQPGMQVQGTMDNPNVMVSNSGIIQEGNQNDPQERDIMQKTADKFGIKQTEIREATIPEEDTLTESVGKSFKRDCSGIGIRSLAVILPCIFIRRNIMKDSDFFGPLIIMLVMGIFTSIGYTSRDHGDAETTGSDCYIVVIAIVLLGSLLCGANMLVLGGSIGVSQAFTLLGYAMLPMSVVSIVLAFVKNMIVTIILEIVTGVWGVVVSVFFMNKTIRGKKKPLAIHPIILVFIGLVAFESWVFGGIGGGSDTENGEQAMSEMFSQYL